MKRIFLVLPLILTVFLYSGCGKFPDPCTPRTPQQEKPEMLAFATANGITTTEHTSGLLFQVINPGSGPIPLPTSKIFVTYTGKLMNGNVFETQNNSAATGWILQTLIQGWQIGLEQIAKGGTVKLIIPSSLAYGCSGVGPIPSNSIVYFEITLVDVQ